MAVFPVSASSHVRDNMILFSNGLVPESWVGQRNVHSAREAVRGDEEKIVTLFSQKQDVVGSVTGMMGKLGYVPSKELLVAVCLMSDTELSNFWGKLKDVMEWDSGAAREMGKHIVYKNFPAEVLAMSECKYWFLQFLRYLGLEPLAETFQEKEIPREELDEAFKGKVISIAAPNALDRITDDLLSKAKDWTDTDRAFVEQLIFKQGVQVDENMVAKVDFNMNLVWLLTLGFEYDVLKQDITLNNPADILRFGIEVAAVIFKKVLAGKHGNF